MSNPKHTSDWLETQVKKLVREELASGCPCNNTDDTRHETAPMGRLAFGGSLIFAGLKELINKVFRQIPKDPLIKERSQVLVFDKLVIHGAVDAQPDDLGMPRGLNNSPVFTRIDSPIDADPRVIVSAFTELLKGSLNRNDIHHDRAAVCLDLESIDFKVAAGHASHVSSPVVAESGAVTPDAPAMTVQENTGAGAVPPSAPAQPRFVQLGASVYDRKLDRFLVAVNEAGARSIADELNVCPDRVVDFKWEDAK